MFRHTLDASSSHMDKGRVYGGICHEKIGIGGWDGTGIHGSLLQGIVYGVRERMGENVLPFLSLESVNVFDIQRFCNEGRYEELTAYLLAAVRNLAAAGAEVGALSANTPHIVFDQLKKQTPIPLVSIIEAACGEANRRGLTRLGLMGTIFTMKGSFFKGLLKKAASRS